MWLACNGEEPAEENEVSQRNFKLTLAVVDFAAAVGQWERYVRFRDLCCSTGNLNLIAFGTLEEIGSSAFHLLRQGRELP